VNVSLTPQLEVFVKQKVNKGLYNSASEVVREALRLLEERDALQAMRLEVLRNDIHQGIDSLDGGGGKLLDIEETKSRARSLRDREG